MMISATDILGASILIVDDQEVNVSLLEQLLGEAGYTSADIGECDRVLGAYLDTVEDAEDGDDDAILAAMEYTVRALNSLNARCNGHLIETDQRGPLRDLIVQAARERGVGSGADLTKPWREW